MSQLLVYKYAIFVYLFFYLHSFCFIFMRLSVK
nr:MAG TPA: hypothetical protein [Caudoviricetes sp.]